jgi:hypothetical protein
MRRHRQERELHAIMAARSECSEGYARNQAFSGEREVTASSGWREQACGTGSQRAIRLGLASPARIGGAVRRSVEGGRSSLEPIVVEQPADAGD